MNSKITQIIYEQKLRLKISFLFGFMDHLHEEIFLDQQLDLKYYNRPIRAISRQFIIIKNIYINYIKESQSEAQRGSENMSQSFIERVFCVHFKEITCQFGKFLSNFSCSPLMQRLRI